MQFSVSHCDYINLHQYYRDHPVHITKINHCGSTRNDVRSVRSDTDPGLQVRLWRYQTAAFLETAVKTV